MQAATLFPRLHHSHGNSLEHRGLANGGLRHAPIRLRALALAADLGLLVVTAPLTLSVLAVLLRPFWVLGAITLGFGYCFAAAVSGQSIGMQLLGVRLVSSRTGRSPHVRAAFVQSLCALLPLMALLTVASALTPAHNGSINGGIGGTYVWLSMFALALSLADHAFAFVDPSRRTLHDRLLGLVVVESRDVRHAHHPVSV